MPILSTDDLNHLASFLQEQVVLRLLSHPPIRATRAVLFAAAVEEGAPPLLAADIAFNRPPSPAIGERSETHEAVRAAFRADMARAGPPGRGAPA